MSRMPPVRKLLSALLILGCIAGGSRGDVLTLDDGTSVNGKVFKEDAGLVWVRTLKGVEKIAAEKVKSRTPGESDVEKYDKLKDAAAHEPIQVAALWDLYSFQKDHLADLPPEIAKENPRILPRILKRDPGHAGAHTEMGEVMYAGQWVKKDDLPKLEAEAAKEKLRIEWQNRIGILVQVEETPHFLLLDNTKDKDLATRAATLEKTWDTLTKALGVEKLWKDRAVIVTVKDYDPYCKAVDSFAGEMAINPTIVAAAKERERGGLWRQRPYAMEIRWPSTGIESMWSAIVHNVAHVAVWTMWKDNSPPAWIDEGMGAWTEIEVMGAQQNFCMGQSKKAKEPVSGGTTDKGPKKKKDPKKNADDLAAARSEFKERCKAAIEADEFPPMRQFLKFGVGDLGPPEEGGVLALVTWLMKIDATKFQKLVKLESLGLLRTEDDYWRQSYGFELVEDMEKKWRGWVLGEW